MSRQPSPGPSQAPPHGHIFQPVSTPSTRQKSRAYATGIAAGAEDVKYQAKYKELKRKVKEIETDNDKLHYKVLQAKRNIHRMKLERAILYERLSALPPSPNVHDRQPLPPMHPGHGVPPQHQQGPPGQSGHIHRDSRERVQQMDPSEHVSRDYMHSHEKTRVVAALPYGDFPFSANPHNAPIAHLHRTPGHDSSRQLPPLSQLTPVQHVDGPRVLGHIHPHTSPHMNPHASRSQLHPANTHPRAHQHSPPSFHPHAQGHPHPQQYPPDALPPVQHVAHSPPHSSERSRQRRRDIHELANPHEGSPQLQIQSHPPPPPPTRSPVDQRSRVHNHQRVGPGANISHDDSRDYDRERDWDREHERPHSPPQRSRPPGERERAPEHQEHIPTSRARDEQAYHERSLLSRSGTPGSGSGNGGTEDVSPPEPRIQVYDSGRAVHPPNSGNENQDGRSTKKGGRYHGHTRGGSKSSEKQKTSKKRRAEEMEVDEEHGVENFNHATGERNEGGNPNRTEDRGTKRHHQEAPPTAPAQNDNQEDAIVE